MGKHLLHRWRGGLVTGSGLASASFALALTFGAFAVHAGLSPLEATAMSLLAFSGSAQFAFVTLFAASGGLWVALGSASLINLRFVPMTAACAQVLRGGRWRKALEAQLVVDGSWAAAQDESGAINRDVLLPATLVQWPAWVAGTAAGAWLTPPATLVTSFGLDGVFPAFFVVLLVDILRDRRDLRIPMGAAALVTAVTLWCAPEGLALLAAAMPAGMVLRTRRPA